MSITIANSRTELQHHESAIWQRSENDRPSEARIAELVIRADQLTGKGMSDSEVCMCLGISPQKLYGWEEVLGVRVRETVA